jgi:hypothetical protein
MALRAYRELLVQLALAPDRAAHLLQGVAGDRLRAAAPSGVFCAIEQICHLRDIEREGYLSRIGCILNQDDPLLTDIDGARLALERDYRSQDVPAALAAFRAAREKSVALLEAANEMQRLRVGHFDGSPPFTLEELACRMREHDAGHLAELEAMGSRARD